MSLSFRKKLKTIVFWSHLIAGIVCGVVIAIMSFTGAMLAFQNETIAWAEGGLRKAEPPAPDAAPLPVAELLRLAAAQKPGFVPATITFDAEQDAVSVLSSGGRGATVFYQNPYTGEVRERGAPRLRAFMNTMLAWHRWLGLSGDARAAGKAVTGACNAAFAVLAGTGLYLWWPRSWKWKHLRTSTVLQWRLRGPARDWNWHNSLGFWCAPVLLVLTITALPISYQWASGLIYAAFGEPPPARQGPPPDSQAQLPAIAKPAPGAKPLATDALLRRAREQLPGWEQMTLRIAAPETPRAVTLSVREKSRWPRTASVQAHFDPYTGGLLRRDEFAGNTPARRLRIWTRFLHTGEALGWPGQLVAGAASLAALVLCYTGFALTWRRFFGGRKKSARESSLRNARQPITP